MLFWVTSVSGRDDRPAYEFVFDAEYDGVDSLAAALRAGGVIGHRLATRGGSIEDAQRVPIVLYPAGLCRVQPFYQSAKRR